MMIQTTKGKIELAELEAVRTVETVPCGELEKCTYYLNGELVRQDINVFVSEAAMAALGTGGL